MKTSRRRVELSALPKECREQINGVQCFQPIFLRPQGTPRPIEEISAHVDSRPLKEVADQAEQSIQQILCRAYSGDISAVRKLARITCGAVGALSRLAEFRNREVKNVAETFPAWPVLISLNPQQIKHAKNEIRLLRVGTKAPTPTRPGQRSDPNNFWTKLAGSAFQVCLANRYIVAVLLANSYPAKRKRTSRKLFGTEIEGTVYTLADDSIVIVPDWVKTLPSLSGTVTEANFDDWWKVVRICILDYWEMFPKEFKKALRQIGQKENELWDQRKLAISAAKQAFRSLTRPR